MTRRALAILAVALAVPASGDEVWSPPGMVNYQFGLLRKGPAWTATRTPATDSIQAGHMANIGRMARDGYLLAAGPLLDGGDLRGIFIFRPDSVDRLRAQVALDPAVRSGRLVLDLFSWFAPTGIGEPYRRMSQRPGYRDSMVRFQLVLLKAGPNAADTTAKSWSSQEAHRRDLVRGLASGELATAGPLRDGGDLRGVMVYRGDSATARRRALDDPAVKAGRLVAEMHPWYAAYGTMPGDTLRGLR